MRTNTTKKRILLATIELLKTDGTNLTVGNIALKACCSRGAINYYFGSKGNLINDAKESIVNQSNIDVLIQKSRFHPGWKKPSYIELDMKAKAFYGRLKTTYYRRFFMSGKIGVKRYPTSIKGQAIRMYDVCRIRQWCEIYRKYGSRFSNLSSLTRVHFTAYAGVFYFLSCYRRPGRDVR